MHMFWDLVYEQKAEIQRNEINGLFACKNTALWYKK